MHNASSILENLSPIELAAETIFNGKPSGNMILGYRVPSVYTRLKTLLYFPGLNP
jgi:hypothetical protein